jgi:hypothetical protein
VALQAVPESARTLTEGHGDLDGDGRGLQQYPLQRREEGDGEEAILFELLLAFTRELIRNIGNRDVIFLSLLAAQKTTGAPPSVMTKLEKAVAQEYKKSTVWPKGFF